MQEVAIEDLFGTPRMDGELGTHVANAQIRPYQYATIVFKCGCVHFKNSGLYANTNIQRHVHAHTHKHMHTHSHLLMCISERDALNSYYPSGSG